MDSHIQNTSAKLKEALSNNQAKIKPVINIPGDYHILDLTENNRDLASFDISSTEKLGEYIFSTLEKNNCTFGVGGYGEDRAIYKRRDLFSGESEPRSIHLGIDIWTKEGTSVFSPLPAKIHSFQDNNQFGDYGPTIILEHELEGITFYTLYGHLSRESLENLYKGRPIDAGNKIASVGSSQVNGNWPTHMHFEIIIDMLGKSGDFPGVAKPSEKEYYLTLCPDPNLILKFDKLDS